jgi:hypothetical protein
MEVNNKPLDCLLDKTNFLHDSNIESINIRHKSFLPDITDYPKELIEIDIGIMLALNKDITFSNKNINLTFSAVDSFRINKDINWNWLIFTSKLTENGIDTFYFTIDDYIFIQYKNFSWDFVTMETQRCLDNVGNATAPDAWNE